MNEIFYTGYDLEKAGFNFSSRGRNNQENLELLRGIAGDFVRFSKPRAQLDEQAICNMLIDFTGSVPELMPIVVLSLDGKGEVEKQNIDRNNAVFNQLFEKGI
jgi:hypothetical protein